MGCNASKATKRPSVHGDVVTTQAPGVTKSTTVPVGAGSALHKVKVKHDSVWNFYEKERVLGTGGSCTVYVGDRKSEVRRSRIGQNTTNADDNFAIKVLANVDSLKRELFLEEVRILQQVVHPYIVFLVEAFEDNRQNQCSMVLEMLHGEELFVAAADPTIQFNEQLAARHFKTMLSAISHIHSLDIIHGDLKPENWVFTNKEIDSELKLIDFGCALHTPEHGTAEVFGISPFYASPELIHSVRSGRGMNRQFLKAADMWALGVILYILLVGRRPYVGRTMTVIMQNIREHKLSFPVGCQLSPAARNMIERLLERDPKTRLTAAEALQHEWVTHPENQPADPLPESVLGTLTNVSNAGKLKHAVARMMADNLTPSEAARLNALFNKADKDKSGTLDLLEVDVFLRDLYLKTPHSGSRRLSHNTAEEVVRGIDDDGDNQIGPQEFKRMLQLASLASDDTLIMRAFKMLDTNQDGFVSDEELRVAFDKHMFRGGKYAQDMMREADTDGDGRISFEEFRASMKQGLEVGGLGGKSGHEHAAEQHMC